MGYAESDLAIQSEVSMLRPTVLRYSRRGLSGAKALKRVSAQVVAGALVVKRPHD